jgi:hypothetical protein
VEADRDEVVTGLDFYRLPDEARELVLGLPADDLAHVAAVIEVAPFSFELRPNDLGVEVWQLDEFLGTYQVKESLTYDRAP